jgi:hypothetical protein
MAFVHSLVKTEVSGKRGWCAPVELGEAAPHYISFVIPLDDKGGFFPEYTCETITTEDGFKKIDPHEFVRRAADSFLLRFATFDVWFVVRTVPKEDRRLPYIGKLAHSDFAFRFTEVEPEEPERLDRLYDEANTYIIGCEPFAHYSGIKKLPPQHS